MLKNSESVGICIKDKSSKVIYQNDLCKMHCGNMNQEICTKGCMIGHQRELPESLKQGIRTKGLINSDIGIIDSIVIEDSQTITTLFYDIDFKNKIIEQDLLSLEKSSLTKSETIILKEILAGKSKNDISKKLFISLSTVKSHINNLYKKLPERWKNIKDRKVN